MLNQLDKSELLKKIVPRVMPLWCLESYSLSCLEMGLEDTKPGDYYRGRSRFFYTDYENGLGISFGLEGEGALEVLMYHHLEELHIDFDVIYNTAKENLQRKKSFFKQLIPGVYTSTLRNMADSGLMILKEEILKLDVKGNPLVFILSRSCILVTGDSDVAALNFCLKEMIYGIDNRDIVLETYKLVNNKWVNEDPVCDLELLKEYNILKLHQTVESTNYLLQVFKKNYPEMADFISSIVYKVVKNESCTVLVKRKTNWLPKSDAVVLVSSPELDYPDNVIYWDELSEVFASKMKKLDYHHEIWEFEGYPTDAEIELMTKRTDII